MIVGEHIPTAKNALVKNLYSDLGFEIKKKKSLGNRTYEGAIYTQLTTSDKLHTHHHISV